MSTAPIWLLMSTTSFSPVVSRPCFAISTEVSIKRDLRGDARAHFSAGLAESLVSGKKRAVDRRKLTVQVGYEAVAARAELHVPGFDRGIDPLDLPRDARARRRR